MQLVLGMGDLANAGKQGGVAYAAHVGGAVAGIIFGLVYRDWARALEQRPSNLGWAPPRYRDSYVPGQYGPRPGRW
jgi:membrane associated rhomboid family serine protease